MYSEIYNKIGTIIDRILGMNRVIGFALFLGIISFMTLLILLSPSSPNPIYVLVLAIVLKLLWIVACISSLTWLPKTMDKFFSV